MRLTKKILAALLSILMIASVCTVAASASAENTKTTDYSLKFDDDGKFRLLQISDIEGNGKIKASTLSLISRSVEKYKPNLILLTGDNTSSTTGSNGFKDTMTSLAAAFKGVPFAATFGILDTSSTRSITRQSQYNTLVSDYHAIDYDNNFSTKALPGTGTGCIPIKTSDGKNVAWNLVLFDAGTRDDDGGYGKPGYNTEKPYNNEEGYRTIVEWFKNMNTSMRSYTADGSFAPTLAFQHTALHEFYNTGLLSSCNQTELGAIIAAEGTGYTGYYKVARENKTAVGEYLESATCSGTSTLELYTALAKDGNVKGIFYGNQHKNTLMGETSYVDELNNHYALVQGCCPAANESLAVDNSPALRLFELYDDGSYTTDVVSNKTLDQAAAQDKCYYINTQSTGLYVSEIATGCAKKSANAKQQLTQAGFTVLDFDLNKDAGGHYIYFGYKLSNDPSKAITAVRFQMGKKGVQTPSVIKSSVNGVECSFSPVVNPSTNAMDDLNKEAKGYYIYTYATRDKCSGGITTIAVSETANVQGYVTGTSFSNPDEAADLNKEAGGAYVYLHYKSDTEPVQYEHDKLKQLIEDMNQVITNDTGYYSENSMNALKSSLVDGMNIINSYKENPVNNVYSPADIQKAMKAIRAARDGLSVVVKFEPNGGHMDVTTIEVKVGDKKSAILDLSQYVPTTTQSGTSFLGWSTVAQAATGTTGTIKITENTTLYAVWSQTVISVSDTDTSKTSDTDTNKTIYGDVNCDGKVTMEDVTSLQRIQAQLATHASFGVNSKANSDCNHDNAVNMQDVTTIQRYLAHLINTL
ncbi:MAG: InlB B-repeat-containing protein [Clostridiales bacterium]|nr:InlB B-repeat-containing protein [Clostridiales bacterium]